jgi:hypothetical protein
VYITAQIKKIVLEIGWISAREVNGILAISLKVVPKIQQVLQAILQKLLSFPDTLTVPDDPLA